MRNIFLILSGIVISSNLFAFDTIPLKSNFSGLYAGYGSYHYNDPLESERIYGGHGIPVMFNWTTFSQKYTDEFNFSYSNYDMKPESSENINLTRITARCMRFSYGYHLAFYSAGKMQLYGGAKLNAYLSYRELNYYMPSPADINLIYKNKDLFTSLDLSLVTKVELAKSFLYVEMNSALMGLVTNRIYEKERDPQSDFLFISKLNTFDFNARYYYKISETLHLSLGYGFFYYRYPRIDTVLITKGLHNQIMAGINIKF